MTRVVSCQRSLLFAGVPAALTRAALTAAVGTGVTAEPERSVGHLTGNRAAQEIEAYYDAAGDHGQEQGVFDRRDAALVAPEPGEKPL